MTFQAPIKKPQETNKVRSTRKKVLDLLKGKRKFYSDPNARYR